MADGRLSSMPVSNFAARCRFVIYSKGIEDKIDLFMPEGGLKTEWYLQNMSPFGKMPALAMGDGTRLFEAQVIVDYLLDRYGDRGPSFVPAASAAARALARLVVQMHDVYLEPWQKYMYKGDFTPAQRLDAVATIGQHLDKLEELVAAGGPFLAGGGEPSVADAALFPTYVFYTWILPKYYLPLLSPDQQHKPRPKLDGWFEHVRGTEVGARVYEEVVGGLRVWLEGGRWEALGLTRCDGGPGYTSTGAKAAPVAAAAGGGGGMTQEEAEAQLQRTRLVPVVALNDASHAVPLARALLDAGLPCMEITFRTAAAADSIRAVSAMDQAGMLVGAGTVLSLTQASEAVAAGAQFIVTPALNDDVVRWCQAQGIRRWIQISRWLRGACFGHGVACGYLGRDAVFWKELLLCQTGGIFGGGLDGAGSAFGHRLQSGHARGEEGVREALSEHKEVAASED